MGAYNKEYHREYRKRNIEKIRTYQREWARKNRDPKRAHANWERWYATNQSRILENLRARYGTDPEKFRLKTRKRRGIVGTPPELPSDVCAFIGCTTMRETGRLCADHDHSITDGSSNFRGWLCKYHNNALGMYETCANACKDYLEKYGKPKGGHA